MRRFIAPETLFFLLALAAMLLAFRSRALIDPGTLWHTRVGEMILADGFMRTDPFTFPFEGKTWIPQQWGGEIFMAWLHGIGGFDAMLLVFSALFAAGFTFAFRRLLAGGMGWPLAGAITFFAIVAAGFHFYLRPHVFTILFMIIITAFIIDFDNKRIGWKPLLWLIPIHIIWTNLHGGMLGGLATLGLAFCCWTVVIIMKYRSPIESRKQWFAIALILFACGLTMFVNPIGLELQRTWFRLIGSAALAANIPEHSPMDLERGGDQAVAAFGLLYVLILAGAGRPKLIWLIPLVWLALSIQSIRNGPLFVATTVVMLADIWPNTIWFRRLRTGGDTLASEPKPLPFNLAAWLMPIAIVIVGLYLQNNKISAPLIGHGWTRFDPEYVPLEMIDAVQAIPAHEKIYNDPYYGGFLIWYAPGRKIFMDDRFELCGDAWLKDYVKTVYENPQRFKEWQSQYGIRWAMVSKKLTEDFEKFIHSDPEWIVVQDGKHTTLFRRK